MESTTPQNNATPPVSRRPAVPQRRSSLERDSPNNQKKRLSFSSMPILSKLGLVKTPSASVPSIDTLTPSRPTSSRQSKQTTPLAITTSPALVDNLAKGLQDESAITDEPETLNPSSPSSIMSPLALDPTFSAAETHHLFIPNPTTSASIPQRMQPSPIDSTRSGSTELSVLKEVEENEVPKGRLEHIKTTDLTPRPSSVPKSVWLCSKPPLSPPGSPTEHIHGSRKSASRPLVIRAMSTGRLASEFDDQGRVMCLSNHCERVLKGRSSMPPAPGSCRNENIMTRSVSNQDRQVKRPIIRSRTSDIFPMLTGGGVKKQSSMSRLDRMRSRKEMPA